MIKTSKRGKGRGNGVVITPAEPVVVRVEVEPVTFEIASGQTVQMTARVWTRNGPNEPEIEVVPSGGVWSSSDTDVVSVNASGLVSFVDVGTASIQYTQDGESDATPSAATAVSSSVASVAISPTTLSLIVGQELPLTATPKDSGGNSLLGKTVTWEKEGTGTGDVNVGADSGTDPHVSLIQGATEGDRRVRAVCETIPSAWVTVTVNPAFEGLPAGFDPALRGADLLHSTPWHEMNIGADAGHTDLLAFQAGAGASDGVGGFTGQLVTDPHGDFGTIWRVRHMVVPPWVGQSTIQRAVTFTPVESFWASIVLMFDGNGNTQGAQPTEGGPYSEWFSAFGSGIVGGSTSFKLIFAFPSPNPFGARMQLVLDNGTGIQSGVGHIEPNVSGLAQGATSTTVILPASASTNNAAFPNRTIEVLSGTGAGQTRVVAAGGYVGSTRTCTITVPWTTIPDTTSTVRIQKTESLLTQGGAPVPPWTGQMRTYMKNAGDAAHDMCGTKDHYHIVLRKQRVSDTEYLQFYYVKRLTVAGAWNPWPHYAWKGWRTTNGIDLPYNQVDYTGNKSQSNDGPSEMYTHGACLEVNVATDPWGLADYGQ